VYQVGINKGIILRCTAYQIARFLLTFVFSPMCFDYNDHLQGDFATKKNVGSPVVL